MTVDIQALNDTAQSGAISFALGPPAGNAERAPENEPRLFRVSPHGFERVDSRYDSVIRGLGPALVHCGTLGVSETMALTTWHNPTDAPVVLDVDVASWVPG
jgi:hypothetical protein